MFVKIHISGKVKKFFRSNITPEKLFTASPATERTFFRKALRPRKHLLLDLLDLVAEHLVRLHQVRNRLAGVQHRRMVLAADRRADSRQRSLRVLLAQVHRYLARLRDLARTTRRIELLRTESQVFAHHLAGCARS